METPEEKIVAEVKQSYSDVLNRHGYGFQYGVLRQAHKLTLGSISLWDFQVSEFPVEVRGAGTRIDFILKRRGEPNFFLLAECKRANPALSNWCFARAPYINRHRHGSDEAVVMEHAEIQYVSQVVAYAKARYTAPNPCHVGLEVRSKNKKGDSQGESGKAIEDACTQVLRGLNGFINLLATHRHILANWKRADFIPVIFTTANLWLSDVELSSADLASGTVDLHTSNFSRQPWLSYQYHQSPGIKHSASPDNTPSDLGRLMDTEYIRTIFIVSPEGVGPFLQWSSRFDFID